MGLKNLPYTSQWGISLALEALIYGCLDFHLLRNLFSIYTVT